MKSHLQHIHYLDKDEWEQEEFLVGFPGTGAVDVSQAEQQGDKLGEYGPVEVNARCRCLTEWIAIILLKYACSIA